VYKEGLKGCMGGGPNPVRRSTTTQLEGKEGKKKREAGRQNQRPRLGKKHNSNGRREVKRSLGSKGLTNINP